MAVVQGKSESVLKGMYTKKGLLLQSLFFCIIFFKSGFHIAVKENFTAV